MLRFLFWILLLANAALFAYQRGYLESLLPSGREPSRMSEQLNADKIRLLPPEAAAPAPAPLAAAPEPQPVACMEIGNFGAEDARRFEARLAALPLGERNIARRDIRHIVSHMVLIPPQGDREGADRKAGELRRLGITDFYVIQDNSDLRWGISLGVFKTDKAANAYLAVLNQRGVRSARVVARSAAPSLVALQLRGLTPAMRADVEKIRADFPQQEARECEAASPS
jgi:hypothetical protein